MISTSPTRRNFATALARMLSVFGLATLLDMPAEAKRSAAKDEGVRKLNDQGQPADGRQMITPIVEHNGLIYIAGQGAHDNGPMNSWTVETHTTNVLDKVKKLVEAGGSNMDNIIQLGVFLAKIEDYDGMNKVFRTYFPHGGPARTTVAVAALAGNSLVEINCIAVVLR
jgi:2-iminobutanoate/2-iminopropanoate deaminase